MTFEPDYYRLEILNEYKRLATLIKTIHKHAISHDDARKEGLELIAEITLQEIERQEWPHEED